MQNTYDSSQLSQNIPLDQSLTQPSEIRDKLNNHVKKRILSSSPVMTTAETAPTTLQHQGKVTKRSKKDAGDSEPSCSGTPKDEEKAKEKHVHKPDILTSILNEKKASLVRDPEVIAFLKKFNQELQRGRLQK